MPALDKDKFGIQPPVLQIRELQHLSLLVQLEQPKCSIPLKQLLERLCLTHGQVLISSSKHMVHLQKILVNGSLMLIKKETLLVVLKLLQLTQQLVKVLLIKQLGQMPLVLMLVMLPQCFRQHTVDHSTRVLNSQQPKRSLIL
jgi:hypothetical protein